MGDEKTPEYPELEEPVRNRKEQELLEELAVFLRRTRLSVPPGDWTESKSPWGENGEGLVPR